MCSRSAKSTVIAAFFVAIAAGCGAKGGRTVASGEAIADGTPKQPPASSTSQDACGLISKAEAESIVGNALRVQPDEVNPRSSSCNYVPEDGSGTGFSLKVYWSAGKDEMATTKTAMGFAPKLMKQEGINTGGMMALEPIDGLGDEAYYNPIAGSYVLKGDRLLEFDLRLLAFGQPAGAPREKWLALARKAVDRL
jgi:hypothetical protein